MANISQYAIGGWNLLAQIGWSIWPTTVANSACTNLISLSLENTTILSAHHVSAGSNISTPGSCQSSASSTVDICRVYGVVNTTSDSSVKIEIWMPDTWYGRTLTIGNGGIGGCIGYADIDYGASLHFATIGGDNGHDGMTGVPFLNHPEVINDFAHRSVHVETVIGKQIVEAYYKATPSKSYFMGCSTGGRQAVQSALRYPEDFDGIVGGCPAVNWNHLAGWSGLLTTYIGAPNPELSSAYIPSSLWSIVSKEIAEKCDPLDGLVDGIISEPDDCDFDPEVLLCAEGSTEGCLTRPQVDALHKIYQPLYGSDGQALYPRYDPGAEASPAAMAYFGGKFFPYTSDWMKYVIYNDSARSLDNFSISDIEFSERINAGGVATWDGDLSRFRDHGGKFLAYHGRGDPIIASGISKWLHELISSTLSPHDIDDFYRLFLIPGSSHCSGGPGAWAFGHGGFAGTKSNVINDTDHNILLALVDWVEGGVAPSSITGVGDNLEQRIHCLYPQKSRWSGTEWICVSE